MSAISFSCPNRFRALRVTSIAWCRKRLLFVLTIVHQRPRIYNVTVLYWDVVRVRVVIQFYCRVRSDSR